MTIFRILIVLMGFIVGYFIPGSNSAWANDFKDLERYLKDLQTPINLSNIGDCHPGGEKVACRLKKNQNYALVVGKDGSSTLKKEAKTIDELHNPPYAGYRLNTPSHGETFTLDVENKSPKLPRKTYYVMLENWIVGSKIDNEFKDFASVPKSRALFDKTQLGQAIQQQSLQIPQIDDLYDDIENYSEFLDRAYVIDVEFFITPNGNVFLVDLAGGIGKDPSQRDKLKRRMENVMTALKKYFGKMKQDLQNVL